MSRHLLPIPPGGGWRDVVRGGRPATPSSLPGGGGTFTGAPRHLRKGPRGWRGVVVSAVCLLAGQFGHDTARGSRMILGVHPAPRPRGSLIPTGPAPFPRHGGGVLVRRWRFGRAHTGYLSCGAVARPPQEWANGDRRVGRRAWPRSTRQLLLHQRTAGWGGPPCRRTRTHNAGRRAAPIPAGQRMRWGWVVWVAAGTSPSDLGVPRSPQRHRCRDAFVRLIGRFCKLNQLGLATLSAVARGAGLGRVDRIRQSESTRGTVGRRCAP